MCTLRQWLGPADSGVLNDLDQCCPGRLAPSLDAGPLRFEAEAFGDLLLGRAAKVPDDRETLICAGFLVLQGTVLYSRPASAWLASAMNCTPGASLPTI